MSALGAPYPANGLLVSAAPATIGEEVKRSSALKRAGQRALGYAGGAVPKKIPRVVGKGGRRWFREK